jgi:hypothetical protein
VPLSKPERANIAAGWKVRVGSRDLTITKVVRDSKGKLTGLEAGGLPIDLTAITRVTRKGN